MLIYAMPICCLIAQNSELTVWNDCFTCFSYMDLAVCSTPMDPPLHFGNSIVLLNLFHNFCYRLTFDDHFTVVCDWILRLVFGSV